MAAVDRSPEAAESVDRTSRARALLYDPAARSIAFQLIAVVLVVVVLAVMAANMVANLRAHGIASGFGFLSETAGFAISQHLIPYSQASTYGQAFLVGLLNTLLVAALGVVFATILGFIVGIMRLSGNWLIRNVALAYVEIIRNIPLLLQLLFWYFAVLKQLPSPRQSIAFGLGTYLNIRGLYIPAFVFQPLAVVAGGLLVVGIIATILVARWAKARQDRTGERPPVLPIGLGLILGLPLLGLAVTGFPFTIDVPKLAGFNYTGGLQVQPELVALLLGLVVYTASYIAEVVRAGILSVSKGQREAAAALGLRPNVALRLVIIPQAMRVIIPPLTNQYLNLTKNSSLAVAIGYPDLVAVFSGTVLNQTGQAVECIFITMLVYLAISLLTSTFMNWFNSRIALVER